MTGDFDLTGIDWEPIGNMNDMENPPPLGGDSLRLWIKLCKIIKLIIRKGGYYCKDTDGKRKQKWETYDTSIIFKVR